MRGDIHKNDVPEKAQDCFSLCLCSQKEAYAEQQRLLRAAAVEAEQQRRAAFQETPLTEQEVQRLLQGEDLQK